MNCTEQISVAIVDDDASTCKAVSRLLCAAGMRSVAYASAEAFLDNDSKPGPDCLILDIQLGRMSGFDLQRQLALAGRTVPIIFITAHDEPETRERAQRLGCAAYLRKTDPGQAVIDAIHHAFASRGASSSTPELSSLCG
jgi:FixJ family two-component response regulator